MDARMRGVAFLATWLAAVVAAPSQGSVSVTGSQQARSRYVELSADRSVKARTTVLSFRIALIRPASVLIHTDGSFAPLSRDAGGSIFVEVDGRRATNESTINWRASAAPVRHSFNAVGAVRLRAGAHMVALVAVAGAGSFVVDRSSNLAAFVEPAKRVSTAQLEKQAGPFDFTTLDKRGPDLPHTVLTSVAADARAATVALASGTTSRAAHDGDAMVGIYVDGRHPGPARSLWSVNDTCSCAEVEGPVFTHALVRGNTASSRISLEATEFPWRTAPPFSQGDDPAVFFVRPTASLVALSGGMRVSGAATALRSGFPDQLGTTWDFVCIGATDPWPGCPSTGSAVLLADTKVLIPRDHPGVVMFVAKTRVQGDGADPGGRVSLWLTVDGSRRGSTGIQDLAAPFSISQRTVSASYLAAGARSLRPGRHRVRLYGRADGEFVHLTVSHDLPLLWFD